MSIELGNKLREARERQGLTQKALAEMADVSQQAIQTYESGRSRPRGLVRINRLAEILKLDPAEILPALGSTPGASYSPDAAPGMRFTPSRVEEFLGELTAALPEELRQYVGRSFENKGYKYRTTFMSRKTVVQASQTPAYISGIPPISAIRNNLYKLSLARAKLDPAPVPDRHYLAAVVIENAERPLPAGLTAEAALLDFDLEQLPSVAALVERIVALEQTETPLEHLFKDDIGGWEADSDFDM